MEVLRVRSERTHITGRIPENAGPRQCQVVAKGKRILLIKRVQKLKQKPFCGLQEVIIEKNGFLTLTYKAMKSENILRQGFLMKSLSDFRIYQNSSLRCVMKIKI